MPSKFANMDEWFVPSYESLMEQVSQGEGLDNLRDSSEQHRDYSEQHHRSRHSNNNSSSSSSQQLHLSEDEIKSAIIGHPQYRELVTAHMNCHKVGAPARLVAEMDELIRKHQDFQPAVTTSIGANPELDQFMVAYCNVLNSYESELKRTFKDAVEFCKRLEQQLNLISNGSVDALGSALSSQSLLGRTYSWLDSVGQAASSGRSSSNSSRWEKQQRSSAHIGDCPIDWKSSRLPEGRHLLQRWEQGDTWGGATGDAGRGKDHNGGCRTESTSGAGDKGESETALEGADDEVDEQEADSADVDVDVDPLAGDKELKRMLMLKYGAFIRGLTQEYLKKKKKGKLPKESRQKLLEWWSQHQDHPYPSEAQKASLARSTGLDPKQINNWFINQRKRHWNPGAARGESSSSQAQQQQQQQEEVGDGEAK